MTFIKYKETKEDQLNRQIREALSAYADHADGGEDVEDIKNVSEVFIKRLAKDATKTKSSLREMMRKSPAWDEGLDAWVINGNRTHEPDYRMIKDWISTLFSSILYKRDDGRHDFIVSDEYEAIKFLFGKEFQSNNSRYKKRAIEILNGIGKGIYAEGKKKSKILRALLVHYGLWDDTAGSNCQKYFALIADELNAKKIDYKLYVSINPAHILTMSNPKYDDRGSMLVSCHSLNSDYKYKNGCIGYARDDISLIAFTVKDNDDMDNLYTRKTTRQMFFYKPNSAVLLQSRMYKAVGSYGDDYGGINGYDELSTEYRHLIQKEIAFCEGVPNLWEKPRKYVNNDLDIRFDSVCGFGGYDDWSYDDWNCSNFAPILSIRKDWDRVHNRFIIGDYGLCFSCGDEHSEGILCFDCSKNGRCNDCDEFYGSDNLFNVYGYYGNSRQVCENCLDETYRFCSECNEYHDIDNMTYLEYSGEYVCNDCRGKYYTECNHCGQYIRDEEIESAVDEDGYDIDICQNCCDRDFHWDDDREVFVSDSFVENDEANEEEE